MGRATVLNSLILSKLWYMLRITPLTATDFKQLRSVAMQFLRRRSIFAVILWNNVWTLSKALQGGLGVINIQLQSSVLYFRCVQPLLTLDQQAIDNHPVFYMLSHHVWNINQMSLSSYSSSFSLFSDSGCTETKNRYSWYALSSYWLYLTVSSSVLHGYKHFFYVYELSVSWCLSNCGWILGLGQAFSIRLSVITNCSWVSSKGLCC